VDEPAVLRWVGLDGLPDGGPLWLDVCAMPAGTGGPGGNGQLVPGNPGTSLPAADALT
jgi:hypothetical protein